MSVQGAGRWQISLAMPRKFSMQAVSRFLVCSVRLLGRCVNAQVMIDAIAANMRLPFLGACVPRNSLEPGLIGCRPFHIVHLLHARCPAKIGPLVISRIAIPVIYLMRGEAPLHQRPDHSVPTDGLSVYSRHEIAGVVVETDLRSLGDLSSTEYVDKVRNGDW